MEGTNIETEARSGAWREDCPSRLASFLRERGADILAAWEAEVRHLPIARDLDRPALLDHLPEILDHIADTADELVAGGTLPRVPVEIAELHALARLEEGFDLGQVVSEFSLLRDCVIQLWAERPDALDAEAHSIRALNQAIDAAVAASISRYTAARDRTIRALDLISTAALESRRLDEFLDRLLAALLASTSAIETATIVLRDGEVLRTHASVGLGEEVGAGEVVALDEGFIGALVRSRRPQRLAPETVERAPGIARLRARGVKAIHGVPLVDDHQVIGVAYMGSSSAPEFSAQDRYLLAALAQRATAAIVQHQLRDAAERRAVQQHAVATLGVHAMSGAELQALFDEVVQRVLESLDVERAAIIEGEGAGERDDAGHRRASAARGGAPAARDLRPHGSRRDPAPG